MATNPVTELLAKQSRSKLKAMLNGIESAEASLKAQRLLILDALDEKGPGAGNAASPRGESDGRGHTGTSAVLKEILRESGGRVLMPKDIIDAARGRGVASSDAAIRVALRRMHRVEHFIERGPDGTGWRLASSDDPVQGPPSEAPSSGLGEHGRQTGRTDDPSPGTHPDIDFDAEIRFPEDTGDQ